MVEVGQGPQRSDPCQLKFGELHCDQELADEIRRGGGRTRKDEEGRDGEEGGRRKDEEGRGRRTSARSSTSDIKSNNPHLAGGEKHDSCRHTINEQIQYILYEIKPHHYFPVKHLP